MKVEVKEKGQNSTSTYVDAKICWKFQCIKAKHEGFRSIPTRYTVIPFSNIEYFNYGE